MKINTIFRITLLLLAFALVTIVNVQGQNMTEIEGTTEIRMNSTAGVPHLQLIEEGTSDGGSTRISLQNHLNPGNNYQIRAFLASPNQRMGWYYNESPRLVYNELTNGLGIGTEYPQAKLHVDGNGLLRTNSSGSSATLTLRETQDDDYARLFFENSNNSTNRWALSANLGTTAEKAIGFFYDGAARVYYSEDEGGLGIGTINPTQLLHLNFTGTNGLRVQGDGTGDARGMYITNTGGSHYIFDDASDDNALVIQSANELAFWTGGGTERMRIDDSTGEVGINGGLNVNRRFGVRADNDLYGIYSDQNGNGSAYALYATTESNGASTKHGIYGSIGGSTGSGTSYAIRGSASTTPTNHWAMYSSGNMWYTGTLMGPSDQRLKKNIQDLEPVLNRVLQLETKTYEFDRETHAGLNLANGPQVGFIAQNVQTLFPTLVEESRHTYEIQVNEETGKVTEGEIDILGISNIEMIPILTKAIQEQQALIEQLRKDLEELRSEK